MALTTSWTLMLHWLLILCAPLVWLPQGSDRSELALAAGRRALAENNHAQAAAHFEQALGDRPLDTQILALLLEATAAQPEKQAYWAMAWSLAALGDDGRLPVTLPAAMRSMPWIGAWAEQRARACLRLMELAETHTQKATRAVEEGLVATYLRRLARVLAAGSPALELRLAGLPFSYECTPNTRVHVLDALQKLGNAALAARKYGQAIRAARCLTGLAAQSTFKDLQGPPPPALGRRVAQARDLLERARAGQAAQAGQPWSVADLEALTAEESEAFTRTHSSFAAPGVALSPTGKYRIETDCGYETLLGVADTVEQHHDRLVAWYGSDPFESRPGTVRVVHEASGLEAEGAPFFWVGGFQAGDITVGRFACSTIEGFGHLLTHELTHRFDGAFYPGIPAWLAEGRAVWTGAAYGAASDSNFVEHHASFGTLEAAFVDGYGAEDKLKQLVSGEPEDYRDNYVAGYALFLYLSSWRTGDRLLYAPRLAAFMQSAASTKLAPLAHFVAHFCDGEAGRPANFGAFAEGFGEYISGFYWKTPKAWAAWYTQAVPDAGPSAWVYDEPTWTWSRQRAEPHFGQEQAREAGRLFLDEGKASDAVHALCWALASDGPSPALGAELALALKAPGQAAAAWVAARTLGIERTAREPLALLQTLPEVRDYVEACQTGQAAASALTWGVVHASLWAEQAELATWGAVAAPSALPANAAVALDRPAGQLAAEGYREDGLTGYEERRVTHLWYADAAGDLHVGRFAPRSGTDRFDRTAHQRDSFVRSTTWLLPGAYRLQARIQCTTSYVAGAVVLGYTRRDQNVRLSFQAGDFMYAIGESEEEPTFETISWSLAGLYLREGALPGSQVAGTLKLDRPKTSFELELRVLDACVELYLEGGLVGRYQTADGQAVEGHIGFATSMGAMRVERPLVQRLDRSALCAKMTEVPLGLNLLSGHAVSFEALNNQRVYGIEPASNGLLLLWLPARAALEDGEQEQDWLLRIRRTIERTQEAMRRSDVLQELVIALPSTIPAEQTAQLQSELAALPRPPRLLTHNLKELEREGGTESPDLGRRWLMFLDQANVARVVSAYISGPAALETSFGHWLRVFREVGQPKRTFPASNSSED